MSSACVRPPSRMRTSSPRRARIPTQSTSGRLRSDPGGPTSRARLGSRPRRSPHRPPRGPTDRRAEVDGSQPPVADRRAIGRDGSSPRPRARHRDNARTSRGPRARRPPRHAPHPTRGLRRQPHRPARVRARRLLTRRHPPPRLLAPRGAARRRPLRSARPRALICTRGSMPFRSRRSLSGTALLPCLSATSGSGPSGRFPSQPQKGRSSNVR